ncbi:MAG: hypothetical protein WC718_04345 [Phycisphaerales bacterium]|jgi:hypothetical protein
MTKRRGMTVGQWVRSACENMRGHLLARRRVTPEEMAEAWPKKGAPTVEWVKCYGTLRAWVYDDAQGVSLKGAAEEEMLAALREEPVRTRLLDGTVVTVYPKGLDALLWFRSRGWLCEWLAVRLEALREAATAGTLDKSGVPEPVTMMARVEHELAFHLGAIAAVATSEGPGGGAYMDPDAEVPEQWANMNPLDLYRIHAAFTEVNAARLDALARIVRPQKGSPDGQQMSWNVFLGSLAMRLNEDPVRLAKDRSLVALLATVRLARDAEPEQEIKA